MTTDKKFLLIRNYDLFSHISDEEYEELNLVHHFIETAKSDYIYIDSAYQKIKRELLLRKQKVLFQMN